MSKEYKVLNEENHFNKGGVNPLYKALGIHRQIDSVLKNSE